MKSNFIHLLFIIFTSIPVKVSWNIADKKKFFLDLKSNLGFYQAVLTISKTSPEILTLTVVEVQHLSNKEKTDSEQELDNIYS